MGFMSAAHARARLELHHCSTSTRGTMAMSVTTASLRAPICTASSNSRTFVAQCYVRLRGGAVSRGPQRHSRRSIRTIYSLPCSRIRCASTDSTVERCSISPGNSTSAHEVRHHSAKQRQLRAEPGTRSHRGRSLVLAAVHCLHRFGMRGLEAPPSATPSLNTFSSILPLPPHDRQTLPMCVGYCVTSSAARHRGRNVPGRRPGRDLPI